MQRIKNQGKDVGVKEIIGRGADNIGDAGRGVNERVFRIFEPIARAETIKKDNNG